MNRPSGPTMKDPGDRELHRREGVDPYPVPRQAEQARRDAGDIDPTEAPDTDAMKRKLKRDGDLDDWKQGRTQGAPRKT